LALGTEKPSDQSGPSPNLRLDSWKDIAAYLKRDIRTAQLWEKKEGLPVHRHTHTTRASVYAYAAEIDVWQKNRRPQVDTELNPSDELPPIPTQIVSSAPPVARRRLTIYAFAGVLIVLALAAVGVASWREVRRQRDLQGRMATVAVLPFEDLSAGPIEGYLADGLTDDLITDLGRSGQLQVISRTSVTQFKGKHESLPRIAQALHANLVLEGTVSYSGKRARIRAQLIDAATDRHLWANSYERDFDNVLTLQDEIADEVAAAVVEKLTGGAANAAHTARPVDPDVRVAYMRGRFFWNKRDEPGLKEAIRYFDQAIAKDSNYAPAYAGLADCYNLLSVWGSLSPHEAFPKAKEAALKALQLDPSSAEAYTSLAFETYRYDWDFAGAEKDFQKAIQLNPNYATGHQWYGEFLGDLRRFDQSIAESRKAERLDPLSTIVGSDLADSYMHAGRYQDGIDELAKILTMDPGFVPAHRYLSEAYGLAGQPAHAAEEKEKYIQLSGDTGAFRVARITEEWSAGEKTKARKEMEDLLQHPGKGRFDLFHMAQMYVGVGDRDKAFDCLERAYQEHSWWLVTLLVDPGLAPVRSDPRLQNLARRVGLLQK
jgi:TolB-like protein/Tfp pilus assembly protein PilF